MKKILGILAILFTMVSGLAFADDDISVIPKGSGTNAAEKVSEVSSGGKVWKIYREIVEDGDLSLGDQFASGIMSWDTILDYCVYIVKFLGEIALLMGALAIVFLGYKRITKNILGETPKGLVLVIVGLLIIIFAYVIVKIIWSAFIS